MTPSRKSVVWKYFIKNEANPKTVTCKICNKEFKYFGGTSNFLHHLLRVHHMDILKSDFQSTAISQRYKLFGSNYNDNSNETKPSININKVKTEMDEDPLELPPTITDIKIENHVESSRVIFTLEGLDVPRVGLVDYGDYSEASTTDSHNAEGHHEPPGTLLRPSGSDYTTRLSDTKIKELDQQILDLITCDLQPLSLVRSPKFVQLCKALQPMYTPPSYEKISKEMLPSIFNQSADVLKDQLRNVEYIAISMENWTSTFRIKYYTITGHFVFAEKLCRRVLFTRQITCEQSDNITEVLLNLFSEWNITNKIVTVVSEAETSIQKAVTANLHLPHHTCIAKTFNSIMFKALTENHKLVAVLKKCGVIFEHLKTNILESDILKSIYDHKEFVFLNINMSYSSGWNHCYIMLEKLMEIKDLQEVAMSNLDSCQYLNVDEWAVISDCLIVLKPAKDLTNILCDEKYPMLSLIIPLLSGFQYTVANVSPETDVGKSLKQTLLNVAISRLRLVEMDRIAAIATFLDPRLKHYAFDSEENAANAQKWVSEELTQLIKGKKTIEQPQTVKCDANSIWNNFDRKLSEKKSELPNTDVFDLVRQYLEMQPEERTSSPLQFWSRHKDILPELYQLAIKYLCVPSTSASCESTFAANKFSTNWNRDSIYPENVNEILFLNSC